MRELIISKNEAGQRLDKYLLKYLNKAGSGFIYKMLRKKNIVLNDKKANGNEKLVVGDNVRLYLSEDTINTFMEIKKDFKLKESNITGGRAKNISVLDKYKVGLIYQDDNILLLNKPIGLLSQKAVKNDIAVNDIAINYLLENGSLTEDDLQTFMPSVCNRLDRNTTGIISVGKSLTGLQTLSALFKDRTISKYYLALVKGSVDKKATIDGYLKKDIQNNKVSISTLAVSKDEDYIKTSYEPVKYIEIMSQTLTLLKVHLITGKTHQIRAHIASIGHPVIGDYKYGDKHINDKFKTKYNISSQLLHSYSLSFPQLDNDMKNLSNKEFIAPLPKFWPVKLED